MAPILGCQLALAKGSSDGCLVGAMGAICARFAGQMPRRLAYVVDGGSLVLSTVRGWGVYEEPERVAVRTLKFLRGVAAPVAGS